MESLIALMLLTIIAVPAFGAIQVALKASALHREIAVSETLLRTAAEQIQNPNRPYIPLAGCAGHSNYSGLPIAARYSPISADVRFWHPQPTVLQPPTLIAAVQAIAANSGQIQFESAGTCLTTDPGLQMIRLSVVTPSGYRQYLTVLKRQG